MRTAIIVTLAMWLLLPTLCGADPLSFDRMEPGTAELGVFTGYGGNHRFPDATRHVFTFDIVGFRIGTYLSRRTELLYSFGIGAEALGATNAGMWSTLAYQHYFRLRPDEAYGFLVCAGVMRFRNAVPELATRTNFVEQLGFTYKRKAADDAAWVIEYRFSHISNANMRVPNIGINASMVTVGYSWYR